MKPSPDKEPPNKQKKWAMPGIAQGNAVYIQDKLVYALLVMRENFVTSNR